MPHLSRSAAAFAAALCLASAAGAQTAPATPDATTPAAVAPAVKPPPFEKEIRAFEEADRKTPPPPGAVLFVGSSSIRGWRTLAQDFPDTVVLNRGFGGSTIPDSIRYADRIVIPYRPRKIVFYAGDNDLSAGRAPATVAADFAAFVGKVRAALPDVPVVFISIKPSPRRWVLEEKMRETNRLVRDWAAGQKDVAYVDAWYPMLGSDGLPRPELYIKDRLHMTPEGYALWRVLLAPRVR